MDGYHIPVLLKESLDALKINPDGVYVDATFGAGGHSKSILKRLSAKGCLYGFDQDEDAHENDLTDSRFVLIRANFRYLDRFLEIYHQLTVDGVLLDLGVSSHQFDQADRGFTYRFDSQLDMRMNQHQVLDAKRVLNTYTAVELQELLSRFGEVRNAKTLSNKIVQERRKSPFSSTSDFNAFLLRNKIGDYQKYQSQVYQALRMEVNDEYGALADALIASANILKPGGRLVVISYHSIEDRLVKNFIKAGNVEGRLLKDDYGHIIKPLKTINKKIIVAGQAELELNSRARSAKMRIAEKV